MIDVSRTCISRWATELARRFSRPMRARFAIAAAISALFFSWIGPGALELLGQSADCIFTPTDAPLPEALSDADVEHIRIELDVNPDRAPASGRASLTFHTATVDDDSVRLIVPGMTIIDVISKELDEALPFRIYGGDTLLVDLSEVRDSIEVSREVITLDVGFEAAHGIQVEDGFAWTIDPYLLGGSWFPWSGDTADRFTSELLVTVPPDIVVAASGTPLAHRETEDGRLTHLFSSVESHTADDLIFAAGPYMTVRSDFRVETMYEGSLETNPGTIAARALEYFESELESPYPYGVLTLSVVPGTEAPISGSGLILVPKDLVEELAAEFPRYSALKIVDAVADQWFGSLVSAETPADRWIEPGVTGYLAALFAQSEIGEEPFDVTMRSLAQAFFEEQQSYRRSLTSGNAFHPMQLNDAHARAKGVWVMHSLRRKIGDNAFWEALAQLVSSSRFGPVATDDLALALSTSADENMDPFFNAWVRAPGNPEPASSYATERDTLFVTVEQQQIADGVPEVYELSVVAEVGMLSGTQHFDVHLSDLRNRVALIVPTEPRFVIIDPDARYLMHTQMEQSLSSWIAQLRVASTTAGRLAAADAIERRRGHPDVLLGLRSALSQDANPYVKAAILDVISTLSASDAAERAILTAYEDTSAVVRSAALENLSAYTESPEVEELAIRAANSDPAPVVQAAAVETLARIGSSEALGVARAALITESPGSIIRRAGLRALMLLDDAGTVALEASTTYSDQEQPLAVRLDAIQLIETLAQRTRSAENVLITMLEAGNWRIRQAAAESLLRIGNDDAVEAFVENEPISWLRIRLSYLLGCS